MQQRPTLIELERRAAMWRALARQCRQHRDTAMAAQATTLAMQCERMLRAMTPQEVGRAA